MAGRRTLNASWRKVDILHHTHRILAGRAVLAVQSIGRGHPVVFLHANVCDSRMWGAQIIAVGAGNTVIAYDRRGFGETQANSEDHSSVADLMAVVDALAGDRPTILVGCSQGGKIAIDAALLHPARVTGLVLIAPSVGGAPEPIYPPEIMEVLARQKAAEVAGDLDLVNAIKARLWLDGPLAPEGRVTGRTRQLFLDMNGIALRSNPPGLNLDNASAFDRLGEITAPSLVIWGDLDFPHIQDRCRHLTDALPNASSLELTDAAHVPSLEQPEIITGPLVAFIQRLLGSGPPPAS